MNRQLANLHPELKLMICTMYVINARVGMNPRILDNGNLRYYVIGINLAGAQKQIEVGLTRRGLPYRFVDAGIEIGTTGFAYVEFEVKA